MPILDDGKTVLCPKCETPLRPHIMFFDETYEESINRCDTIRQFVKEAEAVLVIGTALQTGLSSEIVSNSLEAEKQVVEINPCCEIRRSKVWWMEDKAENVLEAIRTNIIKK
jgi:NAD-dependent SIR2 family protein deacetylase